MVNDNIDIEDLLDVYSFIFDPKCHALASLFLNMPTSEGNIGICKIADVPFGGTCELPNFSKVNTYVGFVTFKRKWQIYDLAGIFSIFTELSASFFLA